MRLSRQSGILLATIVAILALNILCITPVFCQPVSGKDNGYPAVYTGQIIPTADPAVGFTAAAHLLTFPPVILLQVATPATKYMTPMGFIASGPWPLAAYGSAAVRFHILRPGPSRWGIAVQPQVIGSSGAVDAEWLNRFVSALFQGVISSPLQPWRIHFGAALHTMPGEESYYHNDVFIIRKYDFKNMQTTVFARGEVTTHNKKATFFIEGFWLAMGTKEPEDSFALALVGIRFRFGKTWLSVSSGLVHFGKKVSISDSGGFDYLPMPPLLSVIVRL